MFVEKTIKFLIIALIMILGAGCAPNDVNKNHDVCYIYKKNYDWYRSVIKVEKKYGIKSSTIMAIVAQESNYKYNARPPRNYILGIIPWGYKSTAVGYAQVINGAWADYLKENPGLFKSRIRFKNAVDFIGWYLDKGSKKLKVSKNNVEALYLIYHQGISGYQKHEEKKNAKLRLISRQVAQRAKAYDQQFQACSSKLLLWHWLYFWDY